MAKYRNIYEQHYGKIPKDENGRSYEIHHIDGNHNNDSPENLKAVPIQEHYNIHYAQEDWGACYYILMRMQHTPEEISKTCSELATKNALLRVSNGTHNLQGERNPIHKRVADGSHREWLNKKNSKLIKRGLHNFQTRPDGSSLSADRVANGTHNFTYEICKDGWAKSVEKQKQMIEEGNHHSCLERICPYCNKRGSGNSMFRWHFDNCKQKAKNDLRHATNI